MIISKIEYGLGNQLFQYAFAKRISIETNESLKLDISWYENFNFAKDFTPREFSLDRFNTDLDFIQSSKNELKSGSLLKKILLKIRSINLELYLKLTKRLEAWSFENSTLDPINVAIKLKGNKRVIGVWLNHRNLDPIKELLQKEFTIKGFPNQRNAQFLEEINNSNSVFLHIRRGDYIVKNMDDFGGICDERYFEKAINFVKSTLSDVKYFVFSDDIEWCKSRYKNEGNFVFIEGNENDPVEDLRLMISCKNAIISNSTFSWWGAWLIRDKTKIIVAPSLWNRSNHKIVDELLPEDWIKIPVE